MLTRMTGGFPKKSTVDWIEGVSHDAAGMMMSSMGLDKVRRTICVCYLGSDHVSRSCSDSLTTKLPHPLLIRLGELLLLWTPLPAYHTFLLSYRLLDT